MSSWSQLLMSAVPHPCRGARPDAQSSPTLTTILVHGACSVKASDEYILQKPSRAGHALVLMATRQMPHAPPLSQ